eukprot:TRINITY_DN1627_c0_g1_i2.p1 TRINITY_DN1627_c0_g1~~TRINITY_DN1627_c0_g1_i2.p1  ORF type:complete len:203 (+),score=14.29 TRINITY_DN1627_c0_g1_i2:92-700(+)
MKNNAYTTAMHDSLSSMMGNPMFPYQPAPQQGHQEVPERNRNPKRQGEDGTAVPKRRPYTRLACFNCRDKHQKCDGQRPVCFNCLSKGLECNYREERNKRRDVDGGNEENNALRAEVEFWQTKYMELKRFVDETLYHISLSQQLMPYMTQLQTNPNPTETDVKTKTELPQTGMDPMMGGMLGGLINQPFDFYNPASLNNEGL